MKDQIINLESNLTKVLQKHELEYMQAYNIFVKRKETELKQLIDNVTNRLGDQSVQDQKMKRLEINEQKLKQNAVEWSNELTAIKKKLFTTNARLIAEKEEKIFFNCVALDEKKKRKVLKTTLSRVYQEYETLKKQFADLQQELEYTKSIQTQIQNVNYKPERPEDDKTFLTSTLDCSIINLSHLPKVMPLTGSRNLSYLSMRDKSQILPKPAYYINKPMLETINQSRRIFSETKQSPTYKQGLIPTENLKFEQLCFILLNSQMGKQEIQSQLVCFMRDLETNYNAQIMQLQIQLEKQRKATKIERIKNVDKIQVRSELEHLFTESVEDVKKMIIKRRLQSEIQSARSKSQTNQETQKDFEDTLDKLADMAKNRVKIEEFTALDRTNLLEIFVNSEKTLLSINEILFSKQNQASQLQSQSELKTIIGTNNQFYDTSSVFESRVGFDKANVVMSMPVPGSRNRSKPNYSTIDQSSIFKSNNQTLEVQNSEVKSKLPLIQTPQATKLDVNFIQLQLLKIKSSDKK